MQDGRTFIICSLVVRALEGLGNAAFLTSSFSLVAQLFTNSVATVFALGKNSKTTFSAVFPTFELVLGWTSFINSVATYFEGSKEFRRKERRLSFQSLRLMAELFTNSGLFCLCVG
jgi:hypothetical protein